MRCSCLDGRVAAVLGHVELSTTQIYTQVSIRRLKQVHEQTHPGAKLEPRPRDRTRDDEHEPTAEDLLADLDAEAEAEGDDDVVGTDEAR